MSYPPELRIPYKAIRESETIHLKTAEPSVTISHPISVNYYLSHTLRPHDLPQTFHH